MTGTINIDGVAAATSTSHAASSRLPGVLTARGPGAGEMRAATSDLLGTTTRAVGAALSLLLVVLLLHLLARMPRAEGEEERRKADGSRHRQAGMRVPFLRSALRLVSRARAGLAGGSAQLSSELSMPRWRWLGRRTGDERVEKMHGTPEQRRDAESGTTGMPPPASVETEMSEMSTWARPAHVTSGLPKLLGSTSDPPSVLSHQQLALVHRALPPRICIRDWALLYSTEQHGCSLRTAYHRSEGIGPTVLLVLDGHGSIFGAFSGDAWRVDKHYHGNGESFLFKVHPEFEVYPWTRANDHFVLAAHDCLAFGSEDAGIYLDSAFEFGSSKRSSTYANAQLGSSIEFKCIKVEIWTFK